MVADIQFLQDVYLKLENILRDEKAFTEEQIEDALLDVEKLLDMEEEYSEDSELADIYYDLIDDIVTMANEIAGVGGYDYYGDLEDEQGVDLPEGDVFNVFVYGSLKRGFHNNHILKNSKFLGSFITKEKFIMLDLNHFPAVVPSDLGYPVKGEVYEVNRDTFKHLDSLEGYPHLYNRKLINLNNGNTAYIYFMENIRKNEKQVMPKDGILEWTRVRPQY